MVHFLCGRREQRDFEKKNCTRYSTLTIKGTGRRMHGTDVTGSGQILCKHNRASSPRANSTVIFSTCGSQNKKIESEHNEKDVRRKWVEGGMRAFRKNVVTAVFLRSTYRKPTLHAKQVYSIVVGADISLF